MSFLSLYSPSYQTQFLWNSSGNNINNSNKANTKLICKHLLDATHSSKELYYKD